MEPYQSLLDQAKRYALAYMDQVRDMPPYPSEKSLDGLETLEEDLPRSGTEPSAVLELLRAAGENGTTAQTGGRYFGFVNGGSFDPICALCELAETAGAWVHIDGAFGLWAAASKKHVCLQKESRKPIPGPQTRTRH